MKALPQWYAEKIDVFLNKFMKDYEGFITNKSIISDMPNASFSLKQTLARENYLESIDYMQSHHQNNDVCHKSMSP